MANTEAWARRYHQQLEAAGICPSALREQAVPSPAMSQTPTGVRLADCLADPLRLQTVLRDQADPCTSSRQLRARASVLHQGLALSVIAPLTLRLFLAGHSYVPDARDIWLNPTHVTAQWHAHGTAQPIGRDDFVVAVAERVTAWYPLFRQGLGVSPGAYWSSVGLALCAPFSALYDKTCPQTLCDEATAWLNTFNCDAGRFIDWIPAELGGRACAIPQRRGCCLKYLLPDGGYCGTCGIYRKERMAAIKPAHRRSTTPVQWSPAV